MKQETHVAKEKNWQAERTREDIINVEKVKIAQPSTVSNDNNSFFEIVSFIFDDKSRLQFQNTYVSIRKFLGNDIPVRAIDFTGNVAILDIINYLHNTDPNFTKINFGAILEKDVAFEYAIESSTYKYVFVLYGHTVNDNEIVSNIKLAFDIKNNLSSNVYAVILPPVNNKIDLGCIVVNSDKYFEHPGFSPENKNLNIKQVKLGVTKITTTANHADNANTNNQNIELSIQTQQPQTQPDLNQLTIDILMHNKYRVVHVINVGNFVFNRACAQYVLPGSSRELTKEDIPGVDITKCQLH